MSVIPNEDDNNLVRKVLEGERDSFDLLVKKYEKKIFNIAYRITNNGEDAMDVTQTVFTKVYHNLDAYDPSHKFFSWIYRIAVNESLNTAKASRKTSELHNGISSDRPNPEEQYIQGETDKLVQRCITMLSEDYRTVVILKHFVHLSYREIGAVLDIPEKTVKSRLYTARQRLKELLTDG